MLAVVATLFTASCSDDEEYNTNGDVTVAFESATFTTRENAGIVKVPVKVTGARNGNVTIRVATAETGSNPAKANVNYFLTDSTLTLNPDTLTDGTLNVELRMVNDSEENDPRTFTITLEGANGATVGANKTVTVTINDDDSNVYAKFAGKWTLSGSLQTSTGTSDFSKEVTITTATSDAEYGKVLYVAAPSLLNVGIDLDVNFSMAYKFDETAGTGTLGIQVGKEVASYGGTYSWSFATQDGSNVVAEWEPDGKNAPAELDFGPTQVAFYGGDPKDPGTWAIFSNLKLTKK